MVKWLFCLLVILHISVFARAQAPRPNVVFIIADDLGQEDIGCYAPRKELPPFNETPHIDKLAQSGIRFTQAYSASPVCSPSRAALMTGKNPARLKLTNFLVGERTEEDSPVLPAPWTKALAGSEVTLAEKFREKGYVTGMVGKWHLGGKPGESPWEQGFDFTRLIGKNGLDYYNYTIYEDSYQKEFKDDGRYYLTDRLTDYATEFLGKRTDNQPFFLYVAYSAPHVLLVPRGDKVAKYLWKYEKYNRQYNPYYAAMIESMDDGVGKIVAKLKEINQLDNTIFIFTSDNGFVGIPELGPVPNSVSTYRKWKGHVYEGGIRVPLLVSWPGRWAQHVTCETQVVNTDFFNTFEEILGHKPDNTLDSRSFYTSLQQPQQTQSRNDIFWHYPHFSNQLGRPAGAIRQGDWKLVKSYETDQVELYNLASDIGEQKDLAASNPAKANELHQLLLLRLRESGANMPVRK